MKYLIYGAGTIGITYAWLLSRANEVDILVKPEHYEEISKGITIAVKDLREKSADYKKSVFFPTCVKKISGQYDGILVAVNRCQLHDVLPTLTEHKNNTKYFAFMQNNWDIKAEIENYISEDKFIIAFPSSVGGGRDGSGLEVIVFDEATRLGGNCKLGIDDLQKGLNGVGVKTEYDEKIFDWLKVHYLQQSITAGAVLENGDFLSFANDYQAIKKMVKAFREGIEVCRLHGVPVNKTFPANLFKLPTFIVAHTMQKMFLDTNTMEMVNNHMKKGLSEWIAGYKEVLEDGLDCGLPMKVWKSYDEVVEKYLQVMKK